MRNRLWWSHRRNTRRLLGLSTFPRQLMGWRKCIHYSLRCLPSHRSSGHPAECDLTLLSEPLIPLPDMCDGVVLNGFRFNSLSWADHLVLVSTTPRGLQTYLNRLHDYCYKRAISINPYKTVCMIMSKGKCKNRPKFV